MLKETITTWHTNRLLYPSFCYWHWHWWFVILSYFEQLLVVNSINHVLDGFMYRWAMSKTPMSIILLQCKPLNKRFTIQINKIISCLLCPVLACCCVWSLCVLCPPSMAEKNWAITFYFNSHTLFPVDNI